MNLFGGMEIPMKKMGIHPYLASQETTFLGHKIILYNIMHTS